MIKKLWMRVLLRLLDSSFKIDYKQIDKKAVEEWAFRSFDDRGWRSYFAYEDMKLLKTFGQGQEGMTYWVNIGRRLQLLMLFDEMRKAVENRKSVEEKRAAANTTAKN
jgi:hypothetical protein